MAGGRAYEMAFRLNAKLGKSYNSAFARAESVAKKAFGNIAKMGAAIVGGMGIADMANTYKDFQQSIANTGAIAGVSKTSKEYKALENAALEAGKKTTKTAKEAADALGYMSLAGWDTNQSISGLMPVLRLSEASGADLAMTSDLVTDSMSAMGLSVDQLSTYLDVAAQANNKSNQTATQLMEAYIGVGGKFKGLNTPLKESAAILGVLANRGIKGSEAGNSLTSVLTNLTKKSGESYKAMKALGISAYDSSGKFKGITNVVAEVSDKLKSLKTDAERDLYIQMIGGKTQETAFRALLSGYETFTEGGKRELIELQEEMENSSGALEKMAEAMNDTFGGALAILGSASDDMKIQIMKELEPTITPIIRSIADALPGLGAKIAGFVKSLVKKGKEIWNGLKPVFEWVVSNFDKIKIGIAAAGGAFVTAKIAGKIKSVTMAVKGLTLAAKSNPLLLFAEAVVGVGAAIYEARKQAVEANLEKHFGNIVLSVEQINDIADNIVNKRPFEKMFKGLDIQKELKEQENVLQDYIYTVEQMHIKIEMGAKLTIDEKELYKESVNSYVNGIYKYISDEWQSELLLFDGNDFMQKIINIDMSKYEETANSIGKNLVDYVNEGINENGFNIDKEKVYDYFRQLNEIKQQIAVETANEKNKMIVNDFLNGDITEESFKNTMEKINANNEELQNTLIESGIKQKGIISAAYKRGSITEDDYKRETANAENSINESRASIYSNIQEAFLNGGELRWNDYIKDKIPKFKEAVNDAAKAYYFEKNIDKLDTAMKIAIDSTKGGEEGAAFNKFLGLMSDTFEKSETLKNQLPKDSDISKKLEEQSEKYDLYKTGTAGSADGLTIFDSFTEGDLKKSGVFKQSADKALFDGDLDKVQRRLPGDNVEFLMLKRNTEKAWSEFMKTTKKTEGKEKHISDKRYMPPSVTSFNVDIKNLLKKFSKNPVEANLTVNAKTSLNKQALNDSFANNKKEIEKESRYIDKPFEKILQIGLKTSLNQQTFNASIENNKKEASGKVSKIGANPYNTNLTVNAKANLDEQALESSANAAKRQAEKKVSAIFNKFTVNGRLNVGLAVSSTVSSAMEMLSSIGKPKGFATGTEYTPDTFIAGERGAELITGAGGRKVFTALETENIFTNIGRIKDTLVSSVSAVNIFDRLRENEGMTPERIVRPSNTTNNNSSVSVTINNEIKVDGANNKDTDNLKNLINKAMRESGEELAEMIMDIINQNNERKARLSNE